jgi:flavin reductase (DIM6/NTAB) family NADH-FMN oxidoreductase RutF
MPIDSKLFRAAMARLPTGVTVLVAAAPDGGYLGMTASAVTSLSLSPPMVLACIGHAAIAHAALTTGPAFSLNVLAEDQEEVSRRFAARDRQRFDGTGCERTPGDLPRLPGVLACLELRRDALYQGGDHTIVTGVVEWAWARDGAPLVYYLGGYGRLAVP